MKDIIDIARLNIATQELLIKVYDLAQNPLLWAQFAVIAGVFVLARWLATPLLKRILVRLASSCTRVPRFRRPLAALSEVANPISWLALQWMAIGVAIFLEWPSSALNVIASLLSAWLLIRLASMLVANAELAKKLSPLPHGLLRH